MPATLVAGAKSYFSAGREVASLGSCPAASLTRAAASATLFATAPICSEEEMLAMMPKRDTEP